MASPLRKLGALGFSAMMHGYLPLDKEGNQLCEFRTWRNTITEEEAAQLTELFGFNIPPAVEHCPPVPGHPPQRGPCALHRLPDHLGRVRPPEAHRPQRAGRGRGLPACSPSTVPPAPTMRPWRRSSTSWWRARGLPWKLLDILPQVQPAGGDAGFLTEEGRQAPGPPPALWSPARRWLPPEGDAGTGMAATNSVRAPHRQRLRRHLHVRHGGAGEAPVQGLPGD